MIKLQHAKRELNIQNKQNRQQKWIKHIIQSNKKKKKDLNAMTVHLAWGREGEQNQVTICTHASQKVKATKSLPKTREKEKWEIIYTHMYIIQYARWQVPSTERPPLDGIYICVKSNAGLHTPSRTYKKRYFQDRPHGRGSDSIQIQFKVGVETDTPL